MLRAALVHVAEQALQLFLDHAITFAGARLQPGKPLDDAVQVVIGYRGSTVTVSVAGAVHPAVTTALDPSSTSFGLFGEGATAAQCRWQEATLTRAGS